MSSVAFLGRQNAKKLLAVGASPQIILGELTALPRPIAWFKGAYIKASTFKGRVPETLSPPLFDRGGAGGPRTLVFRGPAI